MRRAASTMLMLVPALARAQSPTLDKQNSQTTARLHAVSVVNSDIVWASGIRGTYTRTVDGGRTWTSGIVPGADSLEFRDVHAFDARQALLLAAGPGDRSRIYRTENGGQTWELVFANTDPKAFYDCVDFKGSFGIAVSDAVDGRFPLIRTRNGGRSWEPFDPPGHGQMHAIQGEGAFAASGTCIAITGDGGFRVGTAIGGRVLHYMVRSAEPRETPIVKGAMAGIASLAFRSTKVGVVAGGDLAKPDSITDNVAITRDGGKTWVLGGRPTFAGPIYGVAYTRAKSGAILVAVGPKGASWSSDDAASWQSLAPDDYWGLGFTGNGVGWLVGPEGRLTKVTFR